jgi:hypothetical protein
LALAALLVAFGAEIVRFSLGDLLRQTDPTLSVVVDPSQTEARIAVSRRLLASDVSKIDQAVAGAREALGYNPLSPEALTLVARATEQDVERDRTSELMMLASRVNSRDISSQLWLLDQDLRATRVDSALDRMDVLLRAQPPQVVDQLKGDFPPILTREPYRSAYVNRLRENPPWRPIWFVDLLRRATDLSGLDYLFAELQAGENGPTEAELRAFLTRMTESGMLDEGHDAWLRSLPATGHEESDLLYNAQFHYRLTNLPFDWVITPVPHAAAEVDTESDTQVLNVEFLGGRVKFEHVSHLLNLAPGAYRFEGRERSQDLKNERGLRWRISCIGDTSDTLGTTDLINGEIPWREFGMDFVVPPGKCYYQKLVLELPARTALETEIRGRASFAGLTVRLKETVEK